jgi:hypothetical protein
MSCRDNIWVERNPQDRFFRAVRYEIYYRQYFTHIPSLTGRGIEDGFRIFYQYAVPDGTMF